MRTRLRGRPGDADGGIVSYPLERIYQEVAYIAYQFHWAIDDILAMEHRERQIWVREISEINREINESRKS
ncbi:MAG: hypothetical protein DYH08_16010 [Actinobacteria bacterium ATB1]|nr:hypothetical protein [Actinobacteria bacterium ATB1]